MPQDFATDLFTVVEQSTLFLETGIKTHNTNAPESTSHHDNLPKWPTPAHNKQQNSPPQGVPLRGMPSANLACHLTSANNPKLDELPVPSRHIFLIVRNGDRCRLAQKVIDVYDNGSFSVTDERFFWWVRTEYLKLRDTWRQWLSVWRYNRCDFWQVSRP